MGTVIYETAMTRILTQTMTGTWHCGIANSKTKAQMGGCLCFQVLHSQQCHISGICHDFCHGGLAMGTVIYETAMTRILTQTMTGTWHGGNCRFQNQISDGCVLIFQVLHSQQCHISVICHDFCHRGLAMGTVMYKRGMTMILTQTMMGRRQCPPCKK